MSALLAHIALLEGFVHDLSEESRAYEAGRQVGRGESLREMEEAVQTAHREGLDTYWGLRAAAEMVRSLGPSRPAPPPEELRRQNERLREALREMTELVDAYGLDVPVGSPVRRCANQAIVRARAALGEDAP